VTDVSSVEQAFADATLGLGGIDIVVNVAGGDTDHGRFEETKDEVWVRMLELNLLGVVRCCRAAIAHLRRSTRSPAIVNVSSINALTALGSEPYSSANAGIGSLTVNLAASLAPMASG
jgi:meso-butanediol dehydrogenase / (S,S)-butanediol dehydrogenase / diacetyl reductase